MAKFGAPGGAGMMKQLQRMQQEMVQTQQELEAKQYTASAGGGAVSVTVNGARELTALTISPEAADPADTEMLADIIIAAANQALREAGDDMTSAMSRFTAGLPF
jgi:DNA-binding YbaB/EbfC family protein